MEREGLLRKVDRLERALKDADVASAALQHRVAELRDACARSKAQAEAAERNAAASAAQAQHELEAAQHDANLRTRLLEETVQRLSSSDDQSADVAWLSGQLSSSQRAESRMRTDLLFAERRSDALATELDSVLAAQAVARASDLGTDEATHRVRTETGPDGGAPDEQQGQRHDELVAALAERAEKAEVQLGQREADLRKLRAQLTRSQGAQASDASVIASASKVRPRVAAFLCTIACNARCGDRVLPGSA